MTGRVPRAASSRRSPAAPRVADSADQVLFDVQLPPHDERRPARRPHRRHGLRARRPDALRSAQGARRRSRRETGAPEGTMEAKHGVYSTRTQILEGWGDVRGQARRRTHAAVAARRLTIRSRTRSRATRRYTLTRGEDTQSRDRVHVYVTAGSKAHDSERLHVLPLPAQLHREVVGDAPRAMTRRSVRVASCWSRRPRVSRAAQQPATASPPRPTPCNSQQRPPGQRQRAGDRAGHVRGRQRPDPLPAAEASICTATAPSSIRTTISWSGHAACDEPRFHVTSDFLNYFQADERVVAVGNVHARTAERIDARRAAGGVQASRSAHSDARSR